MYTDLLPLIADPADFGALQLKDTYKALINPRTQQEYPINGKIPQLFQQKAHETKLNSEHHDRLDSHFFYVDHYQKDGELFDYFEEPQNGATIHEHRRLHEAIRAEIPGKERTILDVGCGNAWVAKQLSPNNKLVCSFDISTTNTRKALKKYPFENHYAVNGDVYHLPFRSEVFDVIISAEVIEHVPDLMAYFENLIRVIKPGGKIIISTPYNEKINYSLCIHCNRPTPQHAHLHSFTEAKMKYLLDQLKDIRYQQFAFSNKALIHLKTHIILKHLPYALWKGVDWLANKLWRKPTRLLVVIEKTN